MTHFNYILMCILSIYCLPLFSSESKKSPEEKQSILFDDLQLISSNDVYLEEQGSSLRRSCTMREDKTHPARLLIVSGMKPLIKDDMEQ